MSHQTKMLVSTGCWWCLGRTFMLQIQFLYQRLQIITHRWLTGSQQMFSFEAHLLDPCLSPATTKETPVTISVDLTGLKL